MQRRHRAWCRSGGSPGHATRVSRHGRRRGRTPHLHVVARSHDHWFVDPACRLQSSRPANTTTPRIMLLRRSRPPARRARTPAAPGGRRAPRSAARWSLRSPDREPPRLVGIDAHGVAFAAPRRHAAVRHPHDERPGSEHVTHLPIRPRGAHAERVRRGRRVVGIERYRRDAVVAGHRRLAGERARGRPAARAAVPTRRARRDAAAGRVPQAARGRRRSRRRAAARGENARVADQYRFRPDCPENRSNRTMISAQSFRIPVFDPRRAAMPQARGPRESTENVRLPVSPTVRQLVLPDAHRIPSVPFHAPRHSHRACASNPIPVRVRQEFH